MISKQRKQFLVVACLFCLLISGCRDQTGGDPPERDSDIRDGQDSDVSSHDADEHRDGAADSSDDTDPRQDTDLTEDTGTDADPDGDSTDADAEAEPPPPIPFCQMACGSVADCTTSVGGAFDTDNYTCDDGVCRYIGCHSDGECEETYSSSDYICRDVSGTDMCVKRCDVPDDCVAVAGAFDEDNYRCESHACVYIGCHNDEECRETYSNDLYVCRSTVPPDSGFPIPVAENNCFLSCDHVSDCGNTLAAFDEDNYSCDDSVCRYIGCNSDEECTESFSAAEYVCREF